MSAAFLAAFDARTAVERLAWDRQTVGRVLLYAALCELCDYLRVQARQEHAIQSLDR